MSLRQGLAVSLDDGTSDDELTYARFFEQSGSQLVRLAYLLVGSLADAEDVAQEVLEQIYRRWGDMRQDTVVAYATTAVVNRSRSMLRRRTVARRVAPHLAQPEPGEPTRFEDSLLWDLVQALPRRQREVVVLRYWCDLSEDDIARVLGVSNGTVKSAAHRAQLQLSTWLAEPTGASIRSRKGLE
jgi:RNA polymerase sigma-70 factor (sigma-E family)